MRLGYLSYPYSDFPEKRTKEAIFLGQILLRDFQIMPIIPHINFNILEAGFTEFEILMMEIEMIDRVDMLILGTEEFSNGMKWEIAIAKRFGKPIFSLKRTPETPSGYTLVKPVGSK